MAASSGKVTDSRFWTSLFGRMSDGSKGNKARTYDEISQQDNNGDLAYCWYIDRSLLFDFWAKILPAAGLSDDGVGVAGHTSSL